MFVDSHGLSLFTAISFEVLQYVSLVWFREVVKRVRFRTTRSWTGRGPISGEYIRCDDPATTVTLECEDVHLQSHLRLVADYYASFTTALVPTYQFHVLPDETLRERSLRINYGTRHDDAL